MVTVADIFHHFADHYENYKIIRAKNNELVTSSDGSHVDENGIPIEYWNFYGYKSRRVAKMEVVSGVLHIYIE